MTNNVERQDLESDTRITIKDVYFGLMLFSIFNIIIILIIGAGLLATTLYLKSFF